MLLPTDQGPVLVDITKDAQFGKTTYNYEKCESIRSYFPFPKVNADEVTKAAELINAPATLYTLWSWSVIIRR